MCSPVLEGLDGNPDGLVNYLFVTLILATEFRLTFTDYVFAMEFEVTEFKPDSDEISLCLSIVDASMRIFFYKAPRSLRVRSLI